MNTSLQPLDIVDFRAPGAAPRIAPFWFWNGAMDEDTVRLQVRQMAEGGCGGFFIHARQGLTLPYLSDEWFERVRAAVEEAKACGLQAWLYDEFPYPSGIAGGLLTANRPEMRERRLEHIRFDAPGETPLRHEMPLGRVVSALACPVEDGRVRWERAIDVRSRIGVVLTREQFWLWPMAHIPYNQKRYMADEGRLVLTWTPPPGEWRVFAGVETEFRGFKYYDCFFDPLHPDSAPEFLRLTHERYREWVGEHFGTTIPGIFTDETEPPAWSPFLEDELRREGCDLAELLPALRHDDHPRANEVRLQLRRCALRLFGERWERPIAEWCAQNNLIWTAEKPTWRPSQFGGIAQPATDAGHRRIGMSPEPLTVQLRANHRAAISAAEQSGTEAVRCECFHSLGWGATLQDQKWAIDWLCVQGVNRFTPHAFYGTSSGLTKHDAAPSFFAETPAWPHFRLLGDYTARLSLAMSSGRERARIAVLHPTESLWSGGRHDHRASQEYERLLNLLLAEHHIFHVADALALTRATPSDGALELGRARYETLLVPPLSHADDETVQAVRAALNAGLSVLMFRPLEGANEAATQLAAMSGVTLIDDWASSLNPQRALSVADEDGRELPGVWALWREAGKQQLLFLANTTDEAVTSGVEVVADVAGWQAWSLEDGATTPHSSHRAEGRSRLTVDLPPYGSMLLVSADEQAAPPSTPAAKTVVLPTDGMWHLRLDRPNALRLNRWRLACDESDWADPRRDDAALAEVEALPLRYLDQTRKMWVPACEREAGSTVWYRRHIACDFVPPELQLLIEDRAILGDWTVWINGVEVSSFAPLVYNGSDKTACRVEQLFHRGDNLIALRVQNAPESGGLRTPLHLIGSFGLGGDNQRAIVAPPEQAEFNNLTGAGLPHYSGTAFYRREMSATTDGELELPQGFADVAEVRLNGQSLGVRAWSPYRWRLPQMSGAVEIEVAVTNTLLPFYEGRQWDASAQVAREV